MAKKHWFKVAPWAAGIAALTLAFCLAGCAGYVETDSYTFRFKVQNNYPSKDINKIEFFNGTDPSTSPVLKEVTGFTLVTYALSGEYKVSGFTEAYGDNECYYGVRVTFTDATLPLFGWGHTGHNNKVLADVTYDVEPPAGYKIVCTSGTW
jgi:hypothetical protein